jgi:LL-diaminopimelate aminotransferase
MHTAIIARERSYAARLHGHELPRIHERLDARDVAVEFHSFSKTYNMTGWRLGWAAGPASVISALARIKAFVDTGQFMAVQAGGIAALASYDEWVPGNVEAFRQRRDAAVNAMRGAGFEVETPKAAMYLWLPMPGGQASEPFARRALLEQGVVIMPGSALGPGGEGFFRIALTQPAERLQEAARRLAGLL